MICKVIAFSNGGRLFERGIVSLFGRVLVVFVVIRSKVAVMLSLRPVALFLSEHVRFHARLNP